MKKALYLLLAVICLLMAACARPTSIPNNAPEEKQAEEQENEAKLDYSVFYKTDNQFGKVLYVQVPDARKEYVVSVCKTVKEEYSTSKIQINFYTKYENVVWGKLPLETGASSFAYYSSGAITFYDTSETVETE